MTVPGKEDNQAERQTRPPEKEDDTSNLTNRK